MSFMNLYDLIEHSPEARSYYNELPEYVRQHMDTRADHINSFASLQDYAQNLTRGDN